MPLSAGARLGSCEVLAPLGAGGMGEVYRARDRKLDRDVAIKILPEALAVAQIHGFEESDGTRALVMKLVEGPTLADRIAQCPIPFDDALPIARQIAKALQTAHELGIVHRDLKPANIKLRPDGTVKVLDFGLAKAFERVPAGRSDASASPTITSPALMTGVSGPGR